MTAQRAASLCTLSIAVAALAFASAAGAAVYRCTQAGKVTYTDIPCKGAAVVDVRAGAADPAAVERLEREGAEFNRNMATRRAAEDAAAASRGELYAQQRQAQALQAMAEAAANQPAPYYGPAYGFVAPRVRRRANQHDVKRSQAQRTVPAATRRKRPE